MCTDPLGVAYDPAVQRVVVSAASFTFGVFDDLNDSKLVQFAPDSPEELSNLSLPCIPNSAIPTGPGSTVQVPCYNSTGNWLLTVNLASNQIVSRLPIPFLIDSAAYDPSAGTLYVGGTNLTGTTHIAAVDLDSSRFLWTIQSREASFYTFYGLNQYLLAFDPATDQLLVPNASSNGEGTTVLGIDAATGAVGSTIPIGLSVNGIAYDSATDQLFVVSDQPNDLLVFNGSDYQQEARISLPTCVSNTCAYLSGEAILFDPAHRDVYVLSSVALDVVNLSSLGLVAALEDYGDGSQSTGAYVPSVDAVYGTYSPSAMNGPGFVMFMEHSNATSSETVLGVSVLLFAVLSGVVVAVVIVGLAVWRSRARRPRRPPSSEDFEGPA